MKTPHDLPGWSFDIREVSAGVYRIRGQHTSGANLELKGESPEELEIRAKKIAKEMILGDRKSN